MMFFSSSSYYFQLQLDVNLYFYVIIILILIVKQREQIIMFSYFIFIYFLNIFIQTQNVCLSLCLIVSSLYYSFRHFIYRFTNLSSIVYTITKLDSNYYYYYFSLLFSGAKDKLIQVCIKINQQKQTIKRKIPAVL